MRCAICGLRMDSIDQAVDQGRTPYFHDGRTEHEVARPACTYALLQEGKDGELEVKEEYKGKLICFEGSTEKDYSDAKDLAIEILSHGKTKNGDTETGITAFNYLTNLIPEQKGKDSK